MKRISEDIWQTATERPAPGLSTHAYLFTREGGNILFYNTGLPDEIEAMAPLGGVLRQYLSHRDELGPSINTLAERYGNLFCAHRRERDECARIRVPDILLDGMETHLGAIDIIPTPGHSPGSTCFLVHGEGGRRYLFTGDTLFPTRDGTWRAGLIPGHHGRSECLEMAASLSLLRDLEPDMVLSSAFGDDAGYQRVRSGQWVAAVDAARLWLHDRAEALAPAEAT